MTESGSTYTETQLTDKTIAMIDQRAGYKLTISKNIVGNMGNKTDVINFKVLFVDSIAVGDTVTATNFTDVDFSAGLRTGTNRVLTAASQEGTA